MLLNDRWIREQAERGMISPFVPEQVREGVLSYGLSSYGYDIRVAEEFKVLSGLSAAIIDPKRFDPRLLLDFKGESCLIPPNSFVLARSLEYLRIPRDVLALGLGKSTLARCGIIVNITPLEPEWEGHITIAISNTAPLPTRIYAGEGIAQIIFLRAAEPCAVSYAERQGKYQRQERGIWLPRL